MLDTSRRTIFSDDHELFRDQVRRFIANEVTPNLDDWEKSGIVSRDLWAKCGDAGLLCPTVSEEYGGAGVDFLFNAIFDEELAYAGCTAGMPLQSDIVADYIAGLGTEPQKAEYLPKMVRGEIVTAIAMTEPHTGSDLQAINTTARLDGDSYIVNGSKTYITNGQHADLVIVVAKTDPSKRSKGISLILVEADRQGFSKGRNLDKIGQNSGDTSELFFDNVRVPSENLLGNSGAGFTYLMQNLPQERLGIAIAAQAGAQRAFDEALAFTKDRTAFGGRIFDLQNTRFVLADLAASLQAGWAYLDWALERHVRGELTAEEAAASKLWHTETHWRTVDAALQLHGGAGYMNEYPIARLWRDARVERIYGGTSEIMKEVVSRAL